jgi:hypothetical protein
MSKAEILEELTKLTPAERGEIVEKIQELDGGVLTPEEKLILDREWADFEQNPDAGSTSAGRAG